MRTQIPSLASLSGLRIRRCCELQWGSDPVSLWLWCRPAAVVPIRLLAWELPSAVGAPLKKKKKTAGSSPWANSGVSCFPCSVVRIRPPEKTPWSVVPCKQGEQPVPRGRDAGPTCGQRPGRDPRRLGPERPVGWSGSGVSGWGRDPRGEGPGDGQRAGRSCPPPPD